MKYIKKLTSSMLIFSMLLSGCSKKEEAKEIEEEPVIEETEEVKQDNSKVSIQVADDLYTSIQENMMFSPLSLNLALGLLYEGSDSLTHEQLKQYLGIDNFNEFAYYYMYRAQSLNNEDEQSGYSTQFTIANSIWPSVDIELSDSYQETISKYYYADITPLDFSNAKECADTINQWCNEKTNGMIPEIVNEDMIHIDLHSILTNSIYFESGWVNPWVIEEEQDSFTNLDGTTTNINYMYSNEAYDYYENDYATAFSYSYMNGFQFIGILPKETGDFNLSDLDIPGLLESSLDYGSLEVKMPKLNFETNVDLTDILAGNGLDDLFGDTANFSKMSDTAMKVDTILQKMKIELDENGTKAAAVTMITDTATAYFEGSDIVREVILNRPFAFLIYDDYTGQIVFIGKVINI